MLATHNGENYRQLFQDLAQFFQPLSLTMGCKFVYEPFDGGKLHESSPVDKAVERAIFVFTGCQEEYKSGFIIACCGVKIARFFRKKLKFGLFY